MPSYRELGEHLGVSRPRISQLAKLGMPVHSLTAAEHWRRSNTVSRAPTNGRPRVVVVWKRKRGRPRKPEPYPDSGDALTDTLNASFRIWKRLSELCQEASDEGNSAALRFLIPLHSRTTMSFLKNKRVHDREHERRRLLVEKRPIVERVRRCIETMIGHLKNVPAKCGPLCNPHKPERAIAILERDTADVVETARRALTDLMSY